MSKTYNLPCNIAKTLDIIGDRWTLLIVRDLLLGKSKFSDLKNSLEGISPNILSERLQLLEEEEIVYSKLYSTHPPRMEYFLTEKGKDLRPVLISLVMWGNRYHEEQYNEVIHAECGHTVIAAYHCPNCDKTVADVELKVRNIDKKE